VRGIIYVMSNELLSFVIACIDIVLIFFASQRGLEWLMGSVLVNLVLVQILGTKLITIFGFTTNAGNIFYACVFLATHFILEKYGKKAGVRTVWYGVSCVIFFMIMVQLGTRFVGVTMDNSNIALFSLRVTCASIISYVFAQHINIYIYEWLRIKTKEKFLWVRSNLANGVSQLVDSLLFFSIAFFDVTGVVLLQTIFIGWCIKMVVVCMGTPFLYIDAYINRKKIH
jgi:uncharacterized integral membrane protein (TIGR00697 family)